AGVLALEEQGFYLLREPRGETGAEVIAVNLDLAESDLSTLDPAELASLVAPGGAGDEQARAAALLTPEERERRQAMWWYLLVGVFLLLAAETVLSNRLSRTARGTV
ncbi:MAG TPA: hypothetical protein VGR27_14670, partial [Longimicrobiaceae bacterium]|nr:hypothetical protein [Longimicrobiaceae bacterium]